MTNYRCTNGSNSFFNVSAKTAREALDIAIARFDSGCDYILPIVVTDECGDDMLSICIDENGCAIIE